MRQAIMLLHTRLVAVVTVVLAGLSACGTDTVTMSNTGFVGNDAFVRVARNALSTDGGSAGSDGYVSQDNENFYLAINKEQLGQKWFLSGYLTQWHPSQNIPVRVLGTRVVTFKVQNGKLFVFDATDGKAWSDELDPTVVVEAYPLVTDFAPFNSKAGSSNYILFDPSAGLNRFDVVADHVASNTYVRFQVDLSYLQRFRTMTDGISYEQVFTGYTEQPLPGVAGLDQPFRGSGTVAIALRQYREGDGFVARELPSNNYFGSSNVQYVKNSYNLKQYAVKWNIKPGMKPISWRLSKSLAVLKADPRLAGVDVEGAFARGITGWNDAFGFQVFKVEPTADDDSYGDDDKSFVVIDTNPSAGYAFANWRENPNTGEIRSASVYFSSTFIEGALWSAPVDPVVDAGTGGGSGGGAGGGTGEFDAGTGTCSATATGLVVSQVYGGEGNSNPYNEDFIELHNRGAQAVSLEGLSLQYGSATGSTWQVIPLHGSVPSGGYFLVGLAVAPGGPAGVNLPQVDQKVGINISAFSGKVALVYGTTPLSGCPSSAADGGSTPLIDFVGYGSANCSEAMMPAPALTPSTALLRAEQGCTDDDINAFDLAVSAPTPRNSASAPVVCGCTTSPVPLPQPSADGGTNLIPVPVTGAAAALRWGALTTESTCAMPPKAKALVPAGLTRKDYIERIITHTLLHEVGHTLGLRHNFKGSFNDASVMDYLLDDDSVQVVTPGPYDVAAVKYLYGLSTDAPTGFAFCTDENTTQDGSCARFDATANPLADYAAPTLKAQVRSFLTTNWGLTYQGMWAVTRFVRAPATDAQRIEALNALMSEVAPPLRPDVVALAPAAASRADWVATNFLKNLFLAEAWARDEIATPPALWDPAFASQIAGLAKDILTNRDQVRSYSSRMAMVDVLKEMQSAQAYQALLAARAALVTEKAQYTPEGQALIDDLIRRIDVANSPYFR